MNDFLIISKSYLILCLIQIIFFPLIWKICSLLSDKGWAITRMFGLLLLSLIMWFVGHAGIKINNWLLIFLLLIFFIFNFLIAKKYFFSDLLNWIQQNKILILFIEFLFISGFFLFSYIRAFKPEILYLEKFMDFGFVKRYLVSDTLPVDDMWYAGEKINYYSFGHFFISILIRLWGIIPEIGYNLGLAFIFANCLILSFSFITNLVCLDLGVNINKKIIFGGFVGALVVCIGGNSHAFWYFLRNRSFDMYHYPQATRFIFNTIHEFPAYSFVVSDLHAHLINLPIVLTFLALLILWFQIKLKFGTIESFSIIYDLILGIFLGIMIMTNTWDFLIYGLFMFILGLVLLGQKQVKFLNLFISAIIILVLALLVSLIWFYNFKTISQGISLVNEKSPLKELAILWSGHIIMSFISLYAAQNVLYNFDKKFNSIVLTLCITSFLLLLLPEIIYVKDIYTTYPRANTMFKLTYQAFVLMSLSGGYAFSILINLKKRTFLANIIFLILCIIIFGLLLYPKKAFYTFYQNFEKYKGLNGLKWYKNEFSDEWKIIKFLKKNWDGKNIIEASNESYSKFNAISTFSGVPTVLGWITHEWLWRGYLPISFRLNEIKEFYESKNLDFINNMIAKYNLGWIILTQNEKQKYNVDEYFLKSLGTVCFSSGNSCLVKIK